MMDLKKWLNHGMGRTFFTGSEEEYWESIRKMAVEVNIWLKYLNTETGVTIMHDVLSMAWPAPFVAFMNTKGVDQDGIGLRKRVFLNDQGLGLMTFNDDIIQKIDEKYKTLIVSDHSIATIYNYINKHNRDNNK